MLVGEVGIGADTAQEKAGTIAEEASRFLSRSVQEGHQWLDEIAKAKNLLAHGDTQGLHQLIRSWCLPVETLRRILKPDDHQVQIKIGCYSGGSYRRSEAAPKDSLVVEADTAHGD